jgi:hypothetical protein
MASPQGGGAQLRADGLIEGIAGAEVVVSAERLVGE